MQLTTLLTVCAFALPTITAQTIPAGGCAATVHAILARGESLPGDVDPSVLNVLTTTRDAILSGVPGSTVVGLGYDFKNTNKQAAIVSGVNTFKSYIADYVASCGAQSKIAILGYSLGAMAMMDTLCGTSSVGLLPVFAMDQKYAKNVIAAFTFGDETHNVGQSWAHGTCPQGIGLFPRLASFTCQPFAASLHTYCDMKDDQCCAFHGDNGNVGHFNYGDRYNTDIVNFINSRRG